MTSTWDKEGFERVIEALRAYAEFKMGGETPAALEHDFQAFVALIAHRDNAWIAEEVADAASNLRSLLRKINDEKGALLRTRAALRHRS